VANCGVAKYDRLPARVGWTDVDAMRYAYSVVLGKKKLFEVKFDKVIAEIEEKRLSEAKKE